MSLENPKILGTTTVRYVVKSILNRIQDYTMRHYKYIEQMIYEHYTDLNLWHLDNVEVVYLRMSDAKTVDLPPDYVDYLKIGVPINGKLKVLTRKDNILLPREFEDGEEVGNTDSTESSEDAAIFFTSHFKNGRYIGSLYGIPGGIDTAYYRIDREKRTIVFSGTVPRGEIVLEYISSGVKMTGSTVIPREVVSVLRNYGLWNYYLQKGDARWKVYKSEHDGDIEALIFFQTAFTVDEYKRMLYKTARQSPKR
jgi:hypothetical protein